ncbi:MAG: hypothetical protein HY784_09130, partial [Chloroflexi bacterium]|nr:hypothetical protein [Chloroflexota bacterium]
MSKPPHSLIGYLAAFSRYTCPGVLRDELLCDGDACIIAGSEARLKDYLAANYAALPGRYGIQKVRFPEGHRDRCDDLLRGLRAGGAYAFDEAAYNRFYPQAQRAGLPVGPEDFS